MPKNVQATTQLHSSHMLVKQCSKFSMPHRDLYIVIVESLYVCLCFSVHVVLKARVLKWFAIPFSSGPRFVRPIHHDRPSWVAPQAWISFIELDKAVKGQFSFQSLRKAMPKNAQTTAQLHSSHTLVK